MGDRQRPEALRIDTSGPLRAEVTIVELLGAEKQLEVKRQKRADIKAKKRAELEKQLEALGCQLDGEVAKTGEVAARMGETGD